MRPPIMRRVSGIPAFRGGQRAMPLLLIMVAVICAAIVIGRSGPTTISIESKRQTAYITPGPAVQPDTAYAVPTINGLAGTYYVPAYDKRFVLELYRDGTFYMMKPSSETTTGHWSIKEGYTMLLESSMLTYMMVPTRYQISYSSGQVALSAPHYSQTLTFMKQ